MFFAFHNNLENSRGIRDDPFGMKICFFLRKRLVKITILIHSCDKDSKIFQIRSHTTPLCFGILRLKRPLSEGCAFRTQIWVQICPPNKINRRASGKFSNHNRIRNKGVARLKLNTLYIQGWNIQPTCKAFCAISPSFPCIRKDHRFHCNLYLNL